VNLASPTLDELSPGMVDSAAVRSKLSKQLKIDLDGYEQVHLRREQIDHASIITDAEMDEIMDELGPREIPCTTRVKHLGEYVARIWLRGGYKIPLKVLVVKR
jgi:hypothetical protein